MILTENHCLLGAAAAADADDGASAAHHAVTVPVVFHVCALVMDTRHNKSDQLSHYGLVYHYSGSQPRILSTAGDKGAEVCSRHTAVHS